MPSLMLRPWHENSNAFHSTTSPGGLRMRALSMTVHLARHDRVRKTIERAVGDENTVDNITCRLCPRQRRGLRQYCRDLQFAAGQARLIASANARAVWFDGSYPSGPDVAPH